MRARLIQNEAQLLKELGDRIACRRIAIRLTQQQAAQKAGISVRTWVGAESGMDVRLSTLIEILRVLKLLDNLDVLLPERRLSPVDEVKLMGKVRKRVRKTRACQDEQSDDSHSIVSKRRIGWKWGDEK